MSLVTQFGLPVYHFATGPYRRSQLQALQASGQAPLSVLFYHRVADSHPNPWTISVADFRRQILWLKQHCELVSLSEIQKRMREGGSHRPAVSITFDDGYAENNEHAIPFLLEQQVPTTYFVTFGNVQQQTAFDHDRQAGCPAMPNTLTQIHAMSEAGIEIGSHTRTHCDVAALKNAAQIYDEVIVAGEQLQQAIGKRIRYFAFPTGMPENMSRAAVTLAKRHGLDGICSAFGAYNFPGDDAFHVRRIHGDPMMARLKNWISYDPRKKRIGREFEFAERAVTEQQVHELMDQLSSSTS